MSTLNFPWICVEPATGQDYTCYNPMNRQSESHHNIIAEFIHAMDA